MYLIESFDDTCEAQSWLNEQEGNGYRLVASHLTSVSVGGLGGAPLVGLIVLIVALEEVNE